MQTLRRLAQNREAARKSRLRKKVSEATVNIKMARNKRINTTAEKFYIFIRNEKEFLSPTPSDQSP
jgi:hypothetical protein